MINDLRRDIEKTLFKKRDLFYLRRIDHIIIYLIYLKYLCEIKEYEYEKVIYSNTLYDILYIPGYLKSYLSSDNRTLLLNSLLRNIANINAKDLVLDYIKEQKSELDIYPVLEKKLFYSFLNINAVLGLNISLVGYDIFGKTTYIISDAKDNISIRIFKIFDEILKVHNEYKKLSEIDFTKYEYICIYDDRPKYLSSNSTDSIYKFINEKSNIVPNIILYTKYNKISNFQEGRSVLNLLKIVIIKENDTVMIFSKDSKEISIINYNNSKIKNIDMLKEIINNNRRQKDILIKTNIDEIRKNNMRIGFHLYQIDKENNFNINNIVDENTYLLKELNNLNDKVEIEINNLFNM